MGVTINLQEEILQRCWNVLPEKCPLRKLGYEKFTILWSPWVPYQLATIDPLCKIDHSILLIDFILGTPEQYQSEYMAAHLEWILRHADADYTEKWNKDLLQCKKHHAQPERQLVDILMMEEYLVAINEYQGSATKLDIRKHLCEAEKSKWPAIDDHTGWSALWIKAKKHANVLRSKGGRPPKKLMGKKSKKPI
jgi:hypothetical protein